MDALEVRYVELRRSVTAAGLYKRRYGFYALYAACIVAGVALSLFFLTVTSNPLFQLLNAVFLSIVTVQAGMLGHDLSHGQVFASRGTNRLWGMIVWGIFGGLSESLWYEQHNAHHENVNKVDHDPDINIPFIFSCKQEGGGYSLPHRLVRYQHVIFFVSLPFWYISKVITTWMQVPQKLSARLSIEIILALVHFAILFSLVFWYLPVLTALAFIALHVFTVGVYISFAFAPNHKGEEVVGAEEAVTWKNQITSTRNIYPSVANFLLLGGLNFQIEHHLFPGVARISYWKVQPLVKKFCAENDLPYYETTWPGSLREIYVSLKEVADTRRNPS